VWDTPMVKRIRLFKLVPSALVAVLSAIGINSLFKSFFPELAINSTHLVNLPVLDGFGSLTNELRFLTLEPLTNPSLYVVAFTIAIVASLETLLSVEAVDKLDPHKRRSPTNRELKAQG